MRVKLNVQEIVIVVAKMLLVITSLLVCAALAGLDEMPAALLVYRNF